MNLLKTFEHCVKIANDPYFWIGIIDIVFLISPGALILSILKPSLLSGFDIPKMYLFLTLSVSITAPLAFINTIIIADLDNLKKRIFEAFSAGIFTAGIVLYAVLGIHYLASLFPAVSSNVLPISIGSLLFFEAIITLSNRKHDNLQEIKSIKRIAGDTLLFLYVMQRKGTAIENDVLSFDRGLKNKEQIERLKIGRTLLQIANQSLSDVYNSLRYLAEKKFISFKEGNDNMTYNFFNLRVMADGVDIIEGIERGNQEKNEFHIVFNIKIADNLSVDSLIKTEIGSLLKTSII